MRSAMRRSGSCTSTAPIWYASRGIPYTVQVAAYDSKAAAQDLVTKLGGRGILARFVGATAPYRVRVGHYATDAEAAAAAKQLKTKGIDGFVTTTDNERATAPERK